MPRRELSGLAATGSLTLDGDNVGATSGTYTPTLTFATPGDLSNSYSGTQTGGYERIGDTHAVSFNLNTVTPTWTTASGRLRVSLPFEVSGFSSRLGIIQCRYKPAGIRLPRFASNLRWMPVPGEEYVELAYDMPFEIGRCGAYSLSEAFVAGDNITWGGWTGHILWTESASIGGTADVDQWLYTDGTPAPSGAGWIDGDLAGRGWGILANISTPHAGTTEYVKTDHLTSGTSLILQAGRDGFAV